MSNLFDDEVIEYFLNNQLQLFPEEVASSFEEAEVFLEDCLAIVLSSKEEVISYMEESMDIEGMNSDEIIAQPEVFPLPDGRYLVVEG